MHEILIEVVCYNSYGQTICNLKLLRGGCERITASKCGLFGQVVFFSGKLNK